LGMEFIEGYCILEVTVGTLSVMNRWMGSIAEDAVGNMAIEYSVSNNATVYPGIRYAGRLAQDALGTMSLGEGTFINGGGFQTAGETIPQ
jgi:hypothetical protein